MRYKNKNVLVTGASKGIGAQIALDYAKEGANVLINYSNSEEPARLVKEQIEALGSKAQIYKANVSNEDEVQKMIEYMVAEFGSIDILINNAGITKDSLIMRMKSEDFDQVIDINLKGTFLCSKYACKYMSKNKWGRIINISSVVGVIGNAGQANYSASKAGIIGLTKSFAKEYASKGITSNAVAPGFIQTDMTDKLTDEVKENYLRNIPLSKFGTAKDISNVVRFLSSEESHYITGQVIHVDGGMVM
jgi:3-oxoacyl-[acyl-carrier protein] reductase